jgi:hypothetical protein
MNVLGVKERKGDTFHSENVPLITLALSGLGLAICANHRSLSHNTTTPVDPTPKTR